MNRYDKNGMMQNETGRRGLPIRYWDLVDCCRRFRLQRDALLCISIGLAGVAGWMVMR